MKKLFILLKKDLSCELRAKETLALLFCLALLLSVIVAFSIGTAFLNYNQTLKVFPALIWLVFVFSATVSIARSFEYEKDNNAILGLLLTGIDPSFIYLSKLISNTLLITVSSIISFVSLVVLLNLQIFEQFHSFLILSFLASLGYSALASLLSAMSIGSKLKGMLLPLILLPFLLPLILSAIELSSGLIEHGFIEFSSIWFSILIAFDLIYIVLGINCFQYLVKE